VPLKQDLSKFAKMSMILSKYDLGVFSSHYLEDSVERRLYWRNALTRKRVAGMDRLAWRSDILREVGRELLKCD
jgi:hypothetical protein